MSGRGSSFQQWLDDQRETSAKGNNPASESNETSIFGQLSSIQDSFANQLQELSGSLPDGPLSAAFRQRAVHAIYLLFACIGFAFLAVVVGLPTLVLRPAKFVICMTMSTFCAAGSVIVLQKPSVFFSTLMTGDLKTTAPVIALLLSVVMTTYVTIFIHKYTQVIFCGGLQLLCLLYYLASYIPGGQTGLIVLLKTGYYIVSTLIKPFLFVCKKTVEMIVRRVMS